MSVRHEKVRNAGQQSVPVVVSSACNLAKNKLDVEYETDNKKKWTQQALIRLVVHGGPVHVSLKPGANPSFVSLWGSWFQLG